MRPLGAPESRRGGKLGGKINILNEKKIVYRDIYVIQHDIQCFMIEFIHNIW